LRAYDENTSSKEVSVDMLPGRGLNKTPSLSFQQ